MRMEFSREVQARIAGIEADERYKAKPALVEINAPLALIQTDLGAEVRALKWALGKMGEDRVELVRLDRRKIRRRFRLYRRKIAGLDQILRMWEALEQHRAKGEVEPAAAIEQKLGITGRKARK